MTVAAVESRVVEVSVDQLTEHSRQADFSPQMTKSKWRKFVAGVAEEGILQPLVVTKGFRVIDGKHRLRAAKELGIESVRVIIEDIDEDDIPAYIAETKLNRDDLKPGQRAAIVIRLYYEEERQKAKERQGERTDIVPTLERSSEGRTNEILAKKAGIGKSSMAYLLAVYRSRPDLFELVFNGEYTINRAHTQMKADEAPTEAQEIAEEPEAVNAREYIERVISEEHTNPQIDESLPELAPHNRIVQMRKKALALTAEVLEEAETIAEVDEKVRSSARRQLLSLTRGCVIALGQTSENDEDSELLMLCLQILEKINGGNE